MAQNPITPIYTPSSLDILHVVDVDFIGRQTITDPVNLVQYDKNLPVLEVHLWRGNQKYSAPSNCTVNIRYEKPDGKYVYDHAAGLSSDRTTVYVKISQQMATVSGEARGIIEIITSDDKVAGTATMHFHIDRNPVSEDGIESSDEFKSLIEYVQQSEAARDKSIDAQKKSEQARDQSIAAKNASEAARDKSIDAQKKSETAQALSEDARDKAIIARRGAEAAQVASEDARDKSVIAQKRSEMAADRSEAAQGLAEVAQNKAEVAQGLAEVAQGKAETARAGSEEAQRLAEVARDESIDAQNKSEEARDQSIEAKNASENARDESVAARDASIVAKNESESAQAASETARDAAIVAQNNSEDYSELSLSYLKGGTGVREGEDTDNTLYWYLKTKDISDTLSNALKAIGTITFADLPDLDDVESGWMYNISDDFVTTDEFKEGPNIPFSAGTNVYKTADGYWDVLAGSSVMGVKGIADPAYKVGNVNLNWNNIAAFPGVRLARSDTAVASLNSLATNSSYGKEYIFYYDSTFPASGAPENSNGIGLFLQFGKPYTQTFSRTSRTNIDQFFIPYGGTATRGLYYRTVYTNPISYGTWVRLFTTSDNDIALMRKTPYYTITKLTDDAAFKNALNTVDEHGVYQVGPNVTTDCLPIESSFGVLYVTESRLRGTSTESYKDVRYIDNATLGVYYKTVKISTNTNAVEHSAWKQLATMDDIQAAQNAASLKKGYVARNEAMSEGEALIYLAASCEIPTINQDSNGVFLITSGNGSVENAVQGILAVRLRARNTNDPLASLSWEYVSDSVRLSDYFLGVKKDPETGIVTANLYIAIRDIYDSRIITLLTEGNLTGETTDTRHWTLYKGINNTIGTTRPEGFTYVDSTLNTLANPATPERVYVQNKEDDANPGYFKIARCVAKAAYNSSSLLLSVRFQSDNAIFGILEVKVAVASNPSSIGWYNIYWNYLNVTDVNIPPVNTFFEPSDFFLYLNHTEDKTAYFFEVWCKKKDINRTLIVEKISESTEIDHDHDLLDSMMKWDFYNSPSGQGSAPTGGVTLLAYITKVIRNPAKSLWLPEVNADTSPDYDDLNKYTENGRWFIKWRQAGPPAHMPRNCTDGWLEVQQTDSGNILQVFYRRGVINIEDHEVYKREKYGPSGEWTEWRNFKMASVVRKNVNLNDFRVEGSWYIEDASDTSAAHNLPDGAVGGWLDVKVRNQTVDTYNVVTQIFYRVDANAHTFRDNAWAVSTYRRSAVKNASSTYVWTEWATELNTGTETGRDVVSKVHFSPVPSVSTGIWVRVAKLTGDRNGLDVAKGSTGIASDIRISKYYNASPSECYGIQVLARWMGPRIYQLYGFSTTVQEITEARYGWSTVDNCGYLDLLYKSESSNGISVSITNACSGYSYWKIMDRFLEVPATENGYQLVWSRPLWNYLLPMFNALDYNDNRRISFGYSYNGPNPNEWSFMPVWFDAGGEAGIQLRSIDPASLGTGGKFTQIKAQPIASSWIAGCGINKAALGIKQQLDSGSYHPIINVQTHSNHVFGIGAIYNRFGINGWKADRIAAGTNGVDAQFYFDFDYRNGTWVFHNHKVYLNELIAAPIFVSVDSAMWKNWDGKHGSYACAFGSDTLATGVRSFACGYGGKASGDQAFAAGYWTRAEGEAASALGLQTFAIGKYSFAAGSSARAEGETSISVGYNTKAYAPKSFAAGSSTITNANAIAASAFGQSCQTNKEYSMVSGYWSHAWSIAGLTIGHGNGNTTGSDSSGLGNKNGIAFCIGNGVLSGSSVLTSNAFMVHYAGNVYAAGTYTSNAADYAEYFEWADQNPLFEDRVGLFVTMLGESIKIAEPEDDYILGIVSGFPVVVGNSADDEWYGRYLRDDFGRIRYERAPMIKENEETGEFEIQYDEDGNVMYMGTRPIENPDYDPDEPYVPRQDRPEWAAVGMLGVLSVRQDGTIVGPNCYCTCGEGGVATLCERGDQNAYRVVKVISEEVVKVVFK